VWLCNEILQEELGKTAAPDAQREAFARVRLIAMDVDGVLTNGDITFVPVPGDAEGAVVELKSFGVRDGLAIKWASRVGLKTAILTARESPAVARRARELEVAHVLTGCGHKGEAVRSLAATAGVELSEIAYIGDDLPDLPAMRLVGLPVAPQDAARDVVLEAKVVTSARGGEGAVRELIEMILREQGLWEQVLEDHA